MKKFITRALSGVVYAALIVLSLFTTKWAFVAIWGVFLVIAMLEMGKMLNNKWRYFDLIPAISLYAFASNIVHAEAFMVVSLAFTVLAFVARFIAQLYDKESDPLASLGASCLSYFYVLLSFILLGMIFHIFGGKYVLAMFVFIWANDTGAYLVGMTCGKHKMFERISPKKTWEGFTGGVTLCVILGALMTFTEYFNMNIAEGIAFALIVSLFSTWGDLVESMFKRAAGVKDSGNIIPGHGGILDRIDSLLCVVPVVALFLLLI